MTKYNMWTILRSLKPYEFGESYYNNVSIEQVKADMEQAIEEYITAKEMGIVWGDE